MLKYGKDFNFLKYKTFKQIEVFTSPLLFMNMISSVIISKAVDISLLFTDHRGKSMYSLLKGHQKYLQGANILYVQINYSGGILYLHWRCVEPEYFFLKIKKTLL